MQIDRTYIVALVLIAAALTLGKGVKVDDLLKHIKPTAAQSVSVDVPSAPSNSELRGLAERVRDILQKNNAGSTALSLGQIWHEDANILRNDTKNWIDNTSKVRSLNARSGALAHLESKGKFEGIRSAVDSVIGYGAGEKDGKKPNVKLDEAGKQRVADSFDALSWAAYEGSK